MNKLNIVIINYGVGNTHSVINAVRYLDYKVKVSNDPKMISQADALILPGVGAFDTVMKNLVDSKLDNLLHEEVLVKKKPILGICAGMQMMGTSSEENGFHLGLNWIKGKVVKLDIPEEFRIPHVGWNSVSVKHKEVMFTRLEDQSFFYFDHSYHLIPDDPSHIAATTDYGSDIVAAVQHEHICGVQFHPEKSQTSGLRLFRSFLNSIIQYA